ncbi:hypothetical protein JCM11754A_15050 [Isoptericola variabilis]
MAGVHVMAGVRVVRGHVVTGVHVVTLVRVVVLQDARGVGAAVPRVLVVRGVVHSSILASDGRVRDLDGYP